MRIEMRKGLALLLTAAAGATVLVAGGCEKLIVTRYRGGEIPADGQGAMNGSGGGAVTTDCVLCHIAPQDNRDGVPETGRRPTVLEFPTATIRAHMRGPVPRSADCHVCHDVSGHGNGSVVLLDPDGNGTYAFVRPADLASDPDVSDFCMACHDADGATRLDRPLSPFGNAPGPNIKERFSGTLQWTEWYGDDFIDDTRPRSEGSRRVVNSHHDISDADQEASGAKIECLSCHAGHASAGSQMIADPDNFVEPWTGDVDSFCLKCHGSGTPQAAGVPVGVVMPTVDVTPAGKHCPPETGCSETVTAMNPLESCDFTAEPWYSTHTWTHSVHGADSKRNWPGYSGAPGYALSCTVCHDSHGSFTESNPAGNPYAIRDHVDGTMYVDDGNWDTGWLATGLGGGAAGGAGPEWTTYGTARDVVVRVTPGASPPQGDADYSGVDWGGPTGLCSVCHSTWNDTPPVGTGGGGGAGGSHGSSVHQHWHLFEGCQFCHGHGKPADSHNMYAPNAACDSVCHFPFPQQIHWWDYAQYEDTACADCGNSVLDRFEECDDGNQIDGDGCSNECKFE